MLEFPYGIADFQAIRRDGMVYVDRTSYFREVERLGRTLVFLRPRRFGKSLWLQTLATYYDLRYAGTFDQTFGGLDIRREPTPLANSYFILQWNFSLITPRGGIGDIAESLRRHVRSRAELFLADYQDHLPAASVRPDDSAAEILATLLGAVRRTGHPLYLLIDEYDNFVNEVMVRDVETYKALFAADGPYKELMKAVKNAAEGLGLERVFVTGVSPVALNDLTSGFNTATDVSLEPFLAGLCGFSQTELRGLLGSVANERTLPPEEVDRLLDVMRVWYNGYRFGERAGDLVYNPTNVLYFLRELYLHGTLPRNLHDANLRTDQSKLVFLANTAAGTGLIEELTEGTGEIRIPRLLDAFSLDDMMKRIGKDRGAVASFLYYMGLLTSTEESGRLRIPNLVVRKLFLDRLLEVFLPDPAASYEAREVALHFFEDGDLAPLLAFFEDELLPVLSNRDHGAPPRQSGQSGSGVNEMTLKALFLSILFDDQRFAVHSELEVEKGYADLCLLARPESRDPNLFDILFELKLVRRKTLGKKGRELSDLDESALRELPAVKAALIEARGQVERYRGALVRQRGTAGRVRGYAVVAVGLGRLLGEEVTSGAVPPPRA
jgi:Predicted AAA-ATPase